jgi:hypothetical protein
MTAFDNRTVTAVDKAMRKLAIVISMSALALRLDATCSDWPGRALVFDSEIAAVRVADLNHDGRPDIIALDSSGIHIRFGNGDGTFRDDAAYPIANLGQATLAIGDLDQDGSIDVAVARPDGTIAVLFGRFDGTFAPPLFIRAAASLGHVAIADVTGDGMPDLIATAPNLIVVIPSTPGRRFGTPLTYSGPQRPDGIVIGDFDEDGRPDIVTSEPNGTIALLLNNGHGFASPVSIGLSTLTTALAIGDVNGDGHLDVLASGLGGTIQVLLGHAGTFEQKTFPFRTGPIPSYLNAEQISVFDLDGDGKADLIVTINDTGTRRDVVLLGNADGTLRETVRYSGSVAAIADLDGDGHPDQLYARGRDLAVAHGRSNGTFDAASPIPIDFQPSIEFGDQHAIAAADFDGDGRIDLAVTSLFNGSLTLFPGDSSYLRPATQPGDAWPAREIEAGDVNGDGLSDLVLSSASQPERKRLLLGKKRGGFAPPVDFDAGGRSEFLLSDVNDDGAADVVSIADAPWEVAIAISNGDGTLRPPTLVGSRSATAEPGNVVAADVDGDGNIDLVIVHAIQGSGYELEILTGRGDGTFQAPRMISLAGSATSVSPPPVVRVADLNYDGRPDIVIGGAILEGRNLAIVFLHQPDGSFRQLEPFATEASSDDMVAADFGGDRSIDLAFASASSDDVTVAYGAGDGTFAPPVHFRVDHGPTRLLAINSPGNHNQDLVVLNRDGHALTLLEGDCRTRSRSAKH